MPRARRAGARSEVAQRPLGDRRLTLRPLVELDSLGGRSSRRMTNPERRRVATPRLKNEANIHEHVRARRPDHDGGRRYDDHERPGFPGCDNSESE